MRSIRLRLVVYFLGLLGEAYGQAGDVGRALAVIDQAVDSAGRSGARFQMSELMRMRAEVLLRSGDCDPFEVERILRAAIASAREQGAVMAQLRAAISLAGHLAGRGRKPDARALLHPYCDFITTVRESHEASVAAELL